MNQMGTKLLQLNLRSILIATVHFGPSHIAHNIVGTNENPIVTIGVFIDKNLDKIINNASNKADSMIFLFLDILKHLLFIIYFLLNSKNSKFFKNARSS